MQSVQTMSMETMSEKAMSKKTVSEKTQSLTAGSTVKPSPSAATLICGMGRTQVSQREVAKWCERTTSVRQTVHSVGKAA